MSTTHEEVIRSSLRRSLCRVGRGDMAISLPDDAMMISFELAYIWLSGAGDPRIDLPPESIDANVARDTFEQLLAAVGKPVTVLFPVFAAAAHLADCYDGGADFDGAAFGGGRQRVMLDGGELQGARDFLHGWRKDYWFIRHLRGVLADRHADKAAA